MKQTNIKPNNETNTEDDNRKPVRYTNVERVCVTEWETLSNEGKPFPTYTLSVSYKTDEIKDGKNIYKRSHNFTMRDLIMLKTAIDRAINTSLDEKEFDKVN